MSDFLQQLYQAKIQHLEERVEKLEKLIRSLGHAQDCDALFYSHEKDEMGNKIPVKGLCTCFQKEVSNEEHS
jgi:hypothetical protein